MLSVKDKRVICTDHPTYQVIRRPSSGCKSCWLLYESSKKSELNKNAGVSTKI